MENFNQFELSNQEMIYGGKLIPCVYTTANGGSGKDLVDTTAGTVVYV